MIDFEEIYKATELRPVENKCKEIAEEYRNRGNTLYSKKLFFTAIECYNIALTHCPQDSLECKQLHDSLIGFRSAAFFQRGEYNKVLTDVGFLEEFGNHPQLGRIFLRGGTSAEKLNNFDLAIEYCTKALKCLEVTSATCPNDSSMKIVVANKIQSLNGGDLSTKMIPKPLKLESFNKKYPALSSKLSVQSTAKFGKHIIANQDIDIGEIIAIEAPLVHQTDRKYKLANCATCFFSTNQLISCENCVEVIYCSFACKETARKYHKFECKYLSNLSEVATLALRLIVQNTLHEIVSNFKLDAKGNFKYLNRMASDVSKKLLTHDKSLDSRFKNLLMSEIVQAIKVLKHTGYFGDNIDMETISSKESLIGSLMLKYILVYKFNGFCVGEIESSFNVEEEITSQLIRIGTAIYPTLSLFNHSCETNISRYNVGNVMVFRTLHPIKKDECVSITYRGSYHVQERDSRRAYLKQHYLFDCDCVPCLKKWPTADNMSLIAFIRCDCGNTLHFKGINHLSCKKCKKPMNRLVNKLFPPEDELDLVYSTLKNGKSEKAIEILVAHLRLLAKYIIPPHPIMVSHQGLLENAFYEEGNKSLNYK